MAYKKYVVELDRSERKQLKDFISKGKASAKAILKARILLKADQSEDGEGWTDCRICDALDTNISMVTKVRTKLVNEGLDAVLVRKKRAPQQPIALTFHQDRPADARDHAHACKPPAHLPSLQRSSHLISAGSPSIFSGAA